MVSDDQVAAVRAFNRFYTRQVGLLDEVLLQSEFSLTQVRVLYELAHRDNPTASELARDLGLDAGYLSRILEKFEARGFIARAAAKNDARRSQLSLTRAGKKAFEPLNQAASAETAAMLDRLSAPDREKLVASMRAVERLLSGKAAPEVPYMIRTHHAGDIGWIIHRHGVLYAQEYGWDETFEALVAELAGAFLASHDPARERCWVAERDGAIAGSVFCVRQSKSIAKLRMLYVEPDARGLGIGRKLAGECILFARAKGYKTLTLWTNDVLVSARRIYEAAGFELVKEERHRSFGKDLVGQNWDLELR